MDIANVIISNKLFFFGNKFIKSVEKELNRNKKDGFIPLYLSSIVGESAAIGARLMGVAKAIEGLCAALNDTPKD